MKLSEYVKNYRENHRLSLRQMAEKCDCSFQYISKLEKDEVAAKLIAFLLIAFVVYILVRISK